MKKLSFLTVIAFLSLLFFSSCEPKSEFDLKLDKKVYTPGETIKIQFTANADWDEYAWVGIVPSDVPHGKESENDANDISYQYINKKTSGTFEFYAPDEPGKYDFRMNDSDDSETGLEISSVSFEVK
ncbi:MAG: hypothetical protein JXL97_00765 [Bacteroidales bacterium]|nr:hypothetical protein [Bacteroidales bacterium]